LLLFFKKEVLPSFLVSALLFTALFAPELTPYAPTAINVHMRLATPSPAHLLGTDELGRDLLSRVIMGTREAMAVALASLMASFLVAVPLGLIAGYGGPLLDAALIILFDSLSAVPMIMLGLALTVLLGPGVPTVILTIVMYCTPTYARMVRSQTLALKSRDFIRAEEAMDASAPRILFIHLLPNVIGPLLVLGCLDLSTIIMLDAGLCFLGLGVAPEVPSWGNILSDGFDLIRITTLPLLVGGAPLVLATVGFTLFGEAVRDALDPKLGRGART